MKMRRGSGILLHPTSLPGKFGIGDFGPEAYRFADFLAAAKQTFWQLLPLGPAGEGHSPYNCLSAFAGNPLLISPEILVRRGYLTERDIADPPPFPASSADFARAQNYKEALLRKAFTNFAFTQDFASFKERNRAWLSPFAAFMARRTATGRASWIKTESIHPDPEEIQFQEFVQYEFLRQWSELRAYCHSLGIAIIGDIPFYVEHDSADVWANRDIFHLDKHGNPTLVSGVPPDYFSATGQLWGTPTYRWDRLAETGYAWWVDRLAAALNLFDIVRLDHFRGFEAVWEVPAGAPTAIDGCWVQGPGAALFDAAVQRLGELPFVAENLGLITPAVEELRRKFSLPGMAVLQFSFGPNPVDRPNHYSRDTLACTGTHDNDTIVGWWESRSDPPHAPDAAERLAERDRVLEFVGPMAEPIHWELIRMVMTSPADLVMFPLQDILGLGTEARMNIPGVANGNWRWRFEEDAITPDIIERLRGLTERTNRCV